MFIKYKKLVFVLALLVATISPLLAINVVHADSCPGSDAPATADCSEIPIGCPGATQAGPINKTANLKCPYSPSANSSFTCQAASCVYADASTAGTTEACTNGQQASCYACKTGQVCTDPAATNDTSCTASSCDLIQKYIDGSITLLSLLVGIVAVISIIYGGIQYSMSGGDSQKVTAAKSRITNTIGAFIAYMFIYAFLQFLIPGGIFNK